MYPGRVVRTALALSLLLCAGCLGSTYEIRADELTRLAATKPEDRARRVRVVQQFATEDEPPAATTVGVHTMVVVTSDGYRPYHRRRSAPITGATGSAGGGGSGGGGGGGNPSSAGSSIESAAVLLFLGAGIGLGLAATEGARYDGWVDLHPMHPVHLRFYDGSRGWVPLAQLDPAIAAATEEAVVRREEGPWETVGRAPLDRVGFTYALALGGAGLDSYSAGAPHGFLGRIQLGGFPIQELGLVGSLGLGWGASSAGDAVFNARYGLELHAYPARIGRLHTGAYGQAGYSYSKEDVSALGTTQNRWAPFYGGGVLLEFDLTTRLALTARGGVAALLARDETTIAPEWSLGLAVY